MTNAATHAGVSLVHLTIDGRTIAAPEGRSLLDAALSAGIEIPRLCHDPRLQARRPVRPLRGRDRGAAGAGAGLRDAGRPRGWSCARPPRRSPRCARSASRSSSPTTGRTASRPCTLACPATTDAQGYIGLIAQGRHRDAVELIKQTNPFPGIIGRVCTRPCEDACRRNLVEERIGICFLKRFAADCDKASGRPLPPGGQAAERQARRDRRRRPGRVLRRLVPGARGARRRSSSRRCPRPGGMLRYGIPAYRLPKDILDDEIGEVLRLGVELRTDQRLGRDFTLEQLRADYDAVFLGLGAQAGTGLGLPELPGVMSGVDFLRDIGLGEKIELGKRVVGRRRRQRRDRRGAQRAAPRRRESLPDLPARPGRDAGAPRRDRGGRARGGRAGAAGESRAPRRHRPARGRRVRPDGARRARRLRAAQARAAARGASSSSRSTTSSRRSARRSTARAPRP